MKWTKYQIWDFALFIIGFGLFLCLCLAFYLMEVREHGNDAQKAFWFGKTLVEK